MEISPRLLGKPQQDDLKLTTKHGVQRPINKSGETSAAHTVIKEKSGLVRDLVLLSSRLHEANKTLSYRGKTRLM